MLTDIQLVFIILALTILCFLTPRFRSDMVALSSLMALYITGLLTVQETLSGFSNSVVIMIAALFVVGEGIFQTGLAERAGNLLVKHTGNSEFKMTIFMMLLVALLSGFISNTGTIAIFIPMVVSLCRKMQIHPGRLLMPLAFTSSMGGTLTLIGTAPNLLASQTLVDYGYDSLTFVSFTAIGAIVLVVGVTYLWFIGRKMLDRPHENAAHSANQSEDIDLLKEYNINQYIHNINIPEGFEDEGKTLRDIKWGSVYNIAVLEVIRKPAKKQFILPKSTLRFSAGADYSPKSGDYLIVYGDKEALYKLIEDKGVEITEENDFEDLKLEKARLAEVILTPQSALINQSIEDIRFRDKYDLTILALKHQYKDARRPDQNEMLLYGDTMLVYGEWKDINLLHEEKRDTVVLSYVRKPAAALPHPGRSILAGLILLWMMFMMVFEVLPTVITVIMAALIIVFTRCVRQTDHAYRSINWHTVILIACMLPMATALEKTGGIEYISERLVAGLGDVGPLAVMAGLYIISSVFSQFISNTATAVLLYPVAIMTSQNLVVSPYPMVMAVAFAASMAFATPVATPPNAMVMAAGKYKFMDFMRVGAPIQLITAVFIILLLPIFFPF